MLDKYCKIAGGYDIETDEVVEIIMGQVTTYTFAISGGSEESPLENLVIKVDEKGNLHGGILEYHLTAEEKRMLEVMIPIDLSRKVGWKPVDSRDVAELMMRSGMDCVDINITGGAICPSGNHDLVQMQNHECTYVNEGSFTPSPETIVQIIIDVGCLNGDSGGGGSPGGNGDGSYGPAWFPQQPGFPGSGGGAGPGGLPDNGEVHEGQEPTNPEEPSQDIRDNTFYTMPLLPLDRNKNPCDQLKELFESDAQNPSSKPDIKPLIEDLMEDAASSIDYETGYMFSKTPNNEYTNEWVEPDTNSGSTLPITITVGGDAFGGAHIHTNSLFPMFSWSDVHFIFGVHQYSGAHVKKDAIYILVTKECITCTEVKVYAIKIDNFNKLRTKMQSDLGGPNTASFTPKQKLEHASMQFEKKFYNNPDLEKMFLEEFANNGVSLYTANKDLNNWSKLSLSGSPLAPVNEEPCN